MPLSVHLSPAEGPVLYSPLCISGPADRPVLYDAATHDFTPAALTALREVFSRFDSDLDGLLSRCVLLQLP